MRELLKKPQAKYWALGLAVLVGILFRLIWAADMEYKGDELYMFERSQKVAVSEPWPWLGMPSGVGTNNPGMSIWLFVGIARLFQATDPIALVRGVEILNCLGLILLAVFAARWASDNQEEREAWMWGAAIAAVNPLAVLFERKIWTCSAFSLITVIALIAYMKRERKTGAFFWGLLGACLGQIHMPGFFFSLALVIWATVFDPNRKQTRWILYFMGSVIGALPLIPWLKYMYENPHSHPGLGGSLSLQYWGFWLSDATGTGLHYSLQADFWQFLRFPKLGEHPTFLNGALQVTLLVIGIFILQGAAYRFLKFEGSKLDLILGKTSSTSLALSGSFFGFGLLITLAGVFIHRHYLLVAFPLEFIWLGRIGLYQRSLHFGRKALLSMCLIQALLAASFLYYIHVQGGSPNGDYGIAFSRQKH
jgi:hypothetical protein